MLETVFHFKSCTGLKEGIAEIGIASKGVLAANRGVIPKFSACSLRTNPERIPDCLKAMADASPLTCCARTYIAEARRQAPFDGVRYTGCRSETETFLLGTLLFETGIENPLPTLPAGQALLAGVGKWLVSPPEGERWSLLPGFGAARQAEARDESVACGLRHFCDGICDGLPYGLDCHPCS
jgi:hypothetical protein